MIFGNVNSDLDNVESGLLPDITSGSVILEKQLANHSIDNALAYEKGYQKAANQRSAI